MHALMLCFVDQEHHSQTAMSDVPTCIDLRPRVVADLLQDSVVVRQAHNPYYAQTPVQQTLSTRCIGCRSYGERPVASAPAEVPRVTLMCGQLSAKTMKSARLRWVIEVCCGARVLGIDKGYDTDGRPTGLFEVTVRAEDEAAVLALSGRVMCLDKFLWIPPPGVDASAVAQLLKADKFVRWRLLRVELPNSRTPAAATGSANDEPSPPRPPAPHELQRDVKPRSE